MQLLLIGLLFRGRMYTLTLRSGTNGRKKASHLSIGTWRTRISFNHENQSHLFYSLEPCIYETVLSMEHYSYKHFTAVIAYSQQ